MTDLMSVDLNDLDIWALARLLKDEWLEDELNLIGEFGGSEEDAENRALEIAERINELEETDTIECKVCEFYCGRKNE